MKVIVCAFVLSMCICLMYSCKSGSTKSVRFTNDLAFLMKQSKPAPYRLDSIVLQIYENAVCGLNYVIRELEADTLDEDEFIFIPLFAAKTPVTFLSFPQIKTDSSGCRMHLTWKGNSIMQILCLQVRFSWH